jgi:hypothetical protein
MHWEKHDTIIGHDIENPEKGWRDQLPPGECHVKSMSETGFREGGEEEKQMFLSISDTWKYDFFSGSCYIAFKKDWIAFLQ